LLIERIERLEEEKKAIGDDVKDVYGEAKARGLRYQGRCARSSACGKWKSTFREEADMLLEPTRPRSAGLKRLPGDSRSG
jgi:uncharacterized protein (UPF0335 family)